MMMTRLDYLLNSLDPRITDATNRRVDEAMNTFRCPVQVTRFPDFVSILTRFFLHLEASILNVAGGMPDMGMDFHWGRCVRMLVKAYGHNGEKAAFEISRTGKEGGLYGVLKKVGQVLADEYIDNEIKARIGSYWSSLSVEGKLAAGQEYLEKFGHLLPEELTEGSAARVRANLPDALQQHARMLRDLRRIGRK